MDVSGQIRTICPPTALISSLRDGEALVALLPAGSKLEKAPDGSFAFTLTKDIGPVKLTLPGRMTLVPTGNGHNQTLTLRASHLIGGKIEMDLDVTIGLIGGQTVMSCSGTLNASGIAGQVLRDRKARVHQVFKNALLRIKVQAEREMGRGSAQV